MKEFITFLIIIVAFVAGIGWYVGWFGGEAPQAEEEEKSQEEMMEEEQADEEELSRQPIETIGTSAGGNDIKAYHYWGEAAGTSTAATSTSESERELLFVGGIHGGYSWNTSLVAFELIDYLEENPSIVPENLKVTVIPVLNPDGLEAVTGSTERFSASDVSGDTVPGRFNGNEVDLNRNFDCKWSEEATWRDNPVDPGEGAFSEPEAQALRDYINTNNISAAVVWYSAAGGVYASGCNGEVAEETTSLMNLYAGASGYPAAGYFDAYTITGDAVDWLSTQNIPAVSVILETHDETEWEKNRKGIEAMLEEYGE